MVIFETARLLVRRLVSEDIEDFYFFNSDPEIMQFIRPPQTREQSGFFLDENMAFYKEHPLYGRWAVVDKSTHLFIGSFMLKPSTVVPSFMETGYAFGTKNWGRGYASEVLTGGLLYAFGKCKLPEVIAITHPDNKASQNVLLKCGFIRQQDIFDKQERICLFTIKNSVND